MGGELLAQRAKMHSPRLHSDACFVPAYPQERTEAFCDGHVQAFSFFGGVPRSILYDNTKIAVARILGDGKRQRTQVFSEPGKGNDKGKVEGLVGYELLFRLVSALGD